MRTDVVVIGGGIVGMATARGIRAQDPSARVVVLEKERGVGRHQTGRNSGVIHSGIYYQPGSLKARLCLAGNRSMVDLASAAGLPVARTGKLIVATSTVELPRLRQLADRGAAHGLEVELLGARQVIEFEPNVNAVAAIRVPTTGVVDFGSVSEFLAESLVADGVEVYTGQEVQALRATPRGWEVETDSMALRSQFLVNCAGLHADRLAHLAGSRFASQIVPFRGEYFAVEGPSQHLVRGLVYPVPDPRFPFLGVHVTRGIDGRVHVGPNAVLALSREGYRWRDISFRDVRETLGFGGFRLLARRHLAEGIREMERSLWRRSFLRSVQRLVPDVRAQDLVRSSAGVRAQAVGADGRLVDDFLIEVGANAVHVLNAPSPAATSALEIGRHVARTLASIGGPRAA